MPALHVGAFLLLLVPLLALLLQLFVVLLPLPSVVDEARQAPQGVAHEGRGRLAVVVDRLLLRLLLLGGLVFLVVAGQNLR